MTVFLGTIHTLRQHFFFTFVELYQKKDNKFWWMFFAPYFHNGMKYFLKGQYFGYFIFIFLLLFDRYDNHSILG